MQGRRIQKQLGAFKQREQRSHRQAETVKHRQRVKYRICGVDGFNRRHLLDVGNDVCMAQNHGFRRAFGTGGKQNDRFFVAAVLVRNAFDFVTQIGVDFAPQADFLAQGFQINDFQSVGFQNLNHAFHFGGFDKCRRRNNHAHFRRAAHGGHVFGADRKVQHDRYALIGRKSEKRAHRGNRVGQKQSHGLALRRVALKIFAEYERFDDNVFVGVGHALNVFNEVGAFVEAFFGVNLGGFHQLRKKRNVRIVIAFERHFAQNHIYFVADMVALAAQFVFELKTAGLADCDFHFRQRPVRQPAFGLGK